MMDLRRMHNDIHEGALQLMAEHRVQLFHKAKSLCGDKDSADELVIRTIDQAIRKIDTYTGEGAILSWMMAILTNLHKHDHRSPVVRGTVAVEAEELEKCAGADWSTDERILKDSDSEAIRLAIAGLDPKYHQVLLLRYYEELTLKQIGGILRLPLGTVCRRVQIAHHLLAGKLRAEFGKIKKPLAALAAVLALVSASAAVVASIPSLAPMREAVVNLFAGEDGENDGDANGISTDLSSISANNPKEETTMKFNKSTFAAALALAATTAPAVASNAEPPTADTRQQVLNWFAQNQFGVTPVAPDVKVSISDKTISCYQGAVTIHLEVNIPDTASAANPVPVFVVFGEIGNAANLYSSSVPVDDLLGRGYAYICYNFKDVAANTTQGAVDSQWRTGVLAQCCPNPRGETTWGSIGAWAWGASRVVDWIEKNPLLDSTRIAVVGHSRCGKAALWAAAQDTRIAMAVSCCSGCGGARQLKVSEAGAETIASITSSSRYGYWFAPNFATWAGREAALPYDAADLLGLLKGRLAYVSSGAADTNAGPSGETAAVEAARAAGVTVGRHIREGGHGILAEDWEHYLDFADEHFKQPMIVPGSTSELEFVYESDLTVSGYSGGELQDFPVLVRISPTRISGFSYADCNEDGSDLFFVQGNTVCPHEIDTWNRAGESLVWVRVPRVSAGASFTLRYGGTGLATATPSSAVWAGYAGVWHMDSPSGAVADATGNELTATPAGIGASTQSIVAPGRIGSGRANGSGDWVKGMNSSYLSVQNSAKLDLEGCFTVSGWVKLSAEGNKWPRFMSNKCAGGDENGFEIHGREQTGEWTIRGCGDRYLSPVPNPWKKGEWIHETFIYNGETFSVYANGVLQGSGVVSGGTVKTSENPLSIGSNSDGSEWALYAVLDEFRLRLGVASSDWVAAEYATVNDENFLTAGALRLNPNFVRASLSSVDAYADGSAFSPVLTVDLPTTGATALWSVDGGEFSSSRPAFSEVGLHRVTCLVSAEEYFPVLKYATVRIRNRPMVASFGNATILLGENYPEPSVSNPSSDYLIEWSTDGINFSAEKPVLDSNFVRIYARLSKPGYESTVLSAVVRTISSIAYVSTSGSDTEPYDTPEKAARSLGAAVNVAQDRVVVAPGEYTIESVTIKPGMQIVGPSDRSAVFTGTYATTGEQLTLAENASIAGCTFRNAWTPITSSANSVIENCTFDQCREVVSLGGLLKDCSIVNFGGENLGGSSGRFAVKIASNDALISHCVISNGWNEPAIYLDESGCGTVYVAQGERYSIRLEDTDILYTTNKSAYGSALYSCDGVNASLARCRFIGNLGRVGVARLSFQGSNRQRLSAVNCLFVDNHSSIFGGLSKSPFTCFFCHGELINCTVVENEASTLFGINSDDFIGEMKSVNCIFQNNAIDFWEDVAGGQDGSLRSASYSIFPNAPDANGNISKPARFVGIGGDTPYALAAGSPGIDAGDNLSWTVSDKDISGRSRLVRGRVDLGCYERFINSFIIFIK